MRAARVDLVVETGASFSRAFSLMVPTGELKLASDVIVGDRFFLDGVPSRVAALTRANSWSHFIMEQGLWYDPHVSIPDYEQVKMAEAIVIDEAQSAFWVEGAPVYLPVSISSDGFVAAIQMTDTDTQHLSLMEGGWPWDIFVDTAQTGWMRLAEGTMSIIRGQARTPIVNPLQDGGVIRGHVPAFG